MDLYARIKGETYRIATGTNLFDNLGEELDGGNIQIVHHKGVIDVKPYDDVFIVSANNDSGADAILDNIPHGNGNVVVTEDHIIKFSDDSKYKDYNGHFYWHLLAWDISRDQLNLDNDGYANSTYFNYTISLISETKGLEAVQMPSRTVTQKMRTTATSSNGFTVYEIIQEYVTMYSPMVKTIDTKTDSDEKITECSTWHYSRKYSISEDVKEKFSKKICPEMVFNGSNMREVLTRLFNVCDCIPVVHDGVIFYMDLSKRGTRFSVYGSNGIGQSRTGHETWQIQGSSYCDRMLTEYSQALSENNVTRTVENVGFRSDSPTVTLNNMELKLSYPIYDIASVKMYYYKKFLISEEEDESSKKEGESKSVEESSDPETVVTKTVRNNVITIKTKVTKKVTTTTTTPYTVDVIKTYGIKKVEQDITPFIKRNEQRRLLSTDWTEYSYSSSSTIEEFTKFKYATVGYSQYSNVISGWGEMYTYIKNNFFYNSTYQVTVLENIFRFMDSKYPIGTDIEDIITIDTTNNIEVLDNPDVANVFSSSNIYYNYFCPTYTGSSATNSIFKEDDGSENSLWTSIISTSDTGNDKLFSNFTLFLKTLTFKIEYDACMSPTVVFSKDMHDGTITVRDNQSSALPYLEEDGVAKKEKINKLGNAAITINQRLSDFSDSYKLSDTRYESDGSHEDEIVYRRNFTFINDYINVTYYLCQDYVLRNYFTSVYAKLRPFSFTSESQATERKENRSLKLLVSSNKSYFQKFSDQIYFGDMLKDATGKEYKDIYPDDEEHTFERYWNTYYFIKKFVSFFRQSYQNGAKIIPNYYSPNSSFIAVSSYINPNGLDEYEIAKKFDKDKSYPGVEGKYFGAFSTDFQTFTSGTSLIYNVNMPDSESLGTYVSRIGPNFSSNILNLLFTTVDTDNNTDYITGSLQEYALLPSDEDTGFIADLMLGVGKSTKYKISKEYDNIGNYYISNSAYPAMPSKIDGNDYSNYRYLKYSSLYQGEAIDPWSKLTAQQDIITYMSPVFGKIKERLCKDGSEKMNVSMQIDAIADENIKISPLFVKLSDMMGDVRKIMLSEASSTIEEKYYIYHNEQFYFYSEYDDNTKSVYGCSFAPSTLNIKFPDDYILGTTINVNKIIEWGTYGDTGDFMNHHKVSVKIKQICKYDNVSNIAYADVDVFYYLDAVKTISGEKQTQDEINTFSFSGTIMFYNMKKMGNEYSSSKTFCQQALSSSKNMNSLISFSESKQFENKIFLWDIRNKPSAISYDPFDENSDLFTCVFEDFIIPSSNYEEYASSTENYLGFLKKESLFAAENGSNPMFSTYEFSDYTFGFCVESVQSSSIPLIFENLAKKFYRYAGYSTYNSTSKSYSIGELTGYLSDNVLFKQYKNGSTKYTESQSSSTYTCDKINFHTYFLVPKRLFNEYTKKLTDKIEMSHDNLSRSYGLCSIYKKNIFNANIFWLYKNGEKMSDSTPYVDISVLGIDDDGKPYTDIDSQGVKVFDSSYGYVLSDQFSVCEFGERTMYLKNLPCLKLKYNLPLSNIIGTGHFMMYYLDYETNKMKFVFGADVDSGENVIDSTLSVEYEQNMEAQSLIDGHFVFKTLKINGKEMTFANGKFTYSDNYCGSFDLEMSEQQSDIEWFTGEATSGSGDVLKEEAKLVRNDDGTFSFVITRYYRYKYVYLSLMDDLSRSVFDSKGDATRKTEEYVNGKRSTYGIYNYVESNDGGGDGDEGGGSDTPGDGYDSGSDDEDTKESSIKGDNEETETVQRDGEDTSVTTETEVVSEETEKQYLPDYSLRLVTVAYVNNTETQYESAVRKEFAGLALEAYGNEFIKNGTGYISAIITSINILGETAAISTEGNDIILTVNGNKYILQRYGNTTISYSDRALSVYCSSFSISTENGHYPLFYILPYGTSYTDLVEGHDFIKAISGSANKIYYSSLASSIGGTYVLEENEEQIPSTMLSNNIYKLVSVIDDDLYKVS